ncbi:hypothetical protein [Hymenobacter properus]|uniref:VCBS repeat-containing protein n=1 Tax=Hymenobacter properus TaxID=2791026 RepID=A0A931FLJ1_9BACT|nr:hypothetical protein [Hymenobacter properus]MBF9144268.1 hypothetical protein [Hymenobacter properus]MBR7723086.1 hypothetical protein [Microvirga sp. SRT04]
MMLLVATIRLLLWVSPLPGPPVAPPAPPRQTQPQLPGDCQRQPGEADSAFVRRVLPQAYAQSHDLLAYAWRPSAFGKQLFFSVHGEEGNEYGTHLYVLDPYQENTYAVQILPVMQADDTYLSAIFFDDANRDGHKDLLVLSNYSLLDQVIDVEGQRMYGRSTHHHTDIWQYRGPDKAGRPQYQLLPARPSLDDLPTASEVRGALAPAPRTRHRPAPAKARKR